MRILIFLYILCSTQRIVAKQNVHEFYATLLKKPTAVQEEFKTGFRSCGVRLDAEKFDRKTIIHAYGHGHSGLAFSWITADSVYALLKKNSSFYFGKMFEDNCVAIIGAGVIGLSVAHKLHNEGYRVDVYADAFSPSTFSDNMPGVVTPIYIANEPTLWSEADALKSFCTYAPIFSPINKVLYLPVLNYDSENKFYPKSLSIDVYEKKGKKTAKSYVYTLNPKEYMMQLHEKAVKKGILFHRVQFNTKEDIARLPQKFIINCTGLRAKELFEDTEIKICSYMYISYPHSNQDQAVIKVQNKNAEQYLAYFCDGKCHIFQTYPTINTKKDIEDNVKQFLRIQ